MGLNESKITGFTSCLLEGNKFEKMCKLNISGNKDLDDTNLLLILMAFDEACVNLHTFIMQDIDLDQSKGLVILQFLRSRAS